MTEPLKTIAIADHDPNRVQQLLRLTGLIGYACNGVGTTGLEAMALIQLYKPNVLLLDLHMPGLQTADILQQIIPIKTTAVVLIATDQDTKKCADSMDLGAAAFLVHPFETAQMRSVLQTAWHRYQKELVLYQEIDALKDGLETRKLIDRAKGILIAERGVSEPEAYRLLQKMSQDKRVSIKDVCRAVDQIRLVVGSKTKNKTIP